MLELIKRFFARQEKSTEIEFEKLGEWLDSREKAALSELMESVNALMGSAREEMNALGQALDALKNAKLQNPNIPNRARTMMEGNREAFIRKTSHLANMELDYKTLEEAKEKCSLAAKTIDNLAESTQRSYAIANEFFARELSKISVSIRKIKKCMSDALAGIENSRLVKIRGIKEELDAIKYGKERRLRLLDEVDKEKKNIKKEQNIAAEAEKGINEVKSSSGYHEFEALIKEREEAGRRAIQAEAKLIHDLSSIDKALKKYGKIAFENEKLIVDYIESPLAALLKDESFDIAKVLSKMERHVEANRLEMDSRKKEKTISKLKELDKQYFENARNECLLINAESERIDAKISANDSKKSLDEFEAKLKASREKIEGIKRVISLMEGDISKLDEKKAIKEIQESASKLRENIVIV